LHGTRLQSTHGEDLRAGEEHNEEHRDRHTKKRKMRTEGVPLLAVNEEKTGRNEGQTN
jgi:hypothetical protein